MGVILTWEEKLMVLAAISDDVSLHMRKPGDWYVHTGLEIGNGQFLEGPTARSESPQAAVEEAWEQYTHLAPGEFLVIHAGSERRREYRWNGYAWVEVMRNG
jgi:hypothetical protein